MGRRPSAKELNKKAWYRVLKVVAAFWLILVFLGPWVTHKPNPLLFIDSVIGVSVWVVLLWGIREGILYAVYGKNEKIEGGDERISEKKAEEEGREKELAMWGVGCAILVAIVIALGYFGLL
jgi:hypothetical protein